METSYAFTDPRAQTVWAKKLFEYAMPNVLLAALMGKNANAFIHVSKELVEKVGATIIFKARQRLDNAGVGDDGDTRNSEGQIKRRNMTLVVHERANSTVSAGRMSEKLTDSNFREDSKLELGDWVTECIEDDTATAIFGLYNENSSSGDIETVNENYPSDNRIYYGGQNADGTLANSGASFTTDALLTADTTANNLMGTNLLSAIRRRAVNAQPRFRAGKITDLSKQTPHDVRHGIPGPLVGEFFIVLLHPYHIKAIRAESGTTGWAAMVAAAQNRGNQNQIFTGAAFIWDGMVCWEYDRCPTRTGAGGTTLAEGFKLNAGRTATSDACANGRTVARAALLGSQGCCFGWGMFPQWSEDFVDNNKGKIKVDMIYGAERTGFNAHGTSTRGEDEAIYIIDTEVQVDA